MMDKKMTAKQFRKKQAFLYDHFTKLTPTGIIPDYENIEAFAEKYYKHMIGQSKCCCKKCQLDDYPYK